MEICEQFSYDLVNEHGTDIEVVFLSMAAESEGIDSENWLLNLTKRMQSSYS